MPNRIREIPEGMQAHQIAIKNAAIIPGRRDFAEYFDLGVAEASKGLVSTQVTRLKSGMAQETGWHFHACDFQWLFVLRGWLELQFEDGRTERIDANSACFIPGGYCHNETATSDDLEFIELFMPPSPETVRVEAPKFVAQA